MKIFTVLNQYKRGNNYTDCLVVATCKSREKANKIMEDSIKLEKEGDTYKDTEVQQYEPLSPFLVGIHNHDYENYDEWGIFETELQD